VAIGGKSLSELQAELAAIDATISEIGRVPMAGKVRNTTIDLRGNLEALYRERRRVIGDITACKRQLGLIGPLRRTLY
jgi:hypothetical protein